MNNSTNSSTNDDSWYKHATIDQVFEQFGSTWVLDSIYLFFILPLGLVGFCLNILCFYILKHKEFDKINFYSYFKVITINSALICLIQSTLFSSLTYRYFDFSNTYEANYYATMIYIPVSNVFLLYGSILDMCMSIERSSIFYAKLKILVKTKPNLICFVLFIVSILIGLPYFFINCPSYYDAPYGKNTYFRIWYWEITEFGRSIAGLFLTYANFFIRDVVFMLIELALNIFTIILFRNYFHNKAKLLGNSIKISRTLPISNINTSSSETTNAIAQSSYSTTSNIQALQLYNLSIQEKNLTIMIIIICFLSIIIHIFYLIVATLLFFNDSILTSSTGAFVVFASLLKHMSNIFFLFFFNVNFRNKFKKLFC